MALHLLLLFGSLGAVVGDRPWWWKCDKAPYSTMPYCNQDLDARDRAVDLISHMTMDEKMAVMRSNNPGVPRLGVPPFWFSEALHGVLSNCGQTTDYPGHGTNTGCPTSFPHAMALGSTFNASLWRAVGEAISTEARALHNQNLSGIAYWAPDINLARDPRWGRSQEVPGEDPFLNGEYVMHWSRAMQEGGPSEDKRFLKVVSTAKHFHDYDCEKCYGCNESFAGKCNRVSFNAIVSDQDQVEYYWPAWRAAVEGAHVHSVMCSYNAVNGVPSCGNDFSMNTILRDQWQFDGYVVSDCGAIGDDAFTAYIKTHYGGDPRHQVRQGIQGGCDINCGNFYADHIEAAVNGSVLPQADWDQALVRVWTYFFRLGVMNENVSYASYGPELVDSPAHRELARSAAEQSMVLLKNTDGLLPLAKGQRVALLGPHFNATQDMISIYHGPVKLVEEHSPFMAFRGAGANIVGTAMGCNDTSCLDKSGFGAAVELAKKADVAIVFVGLTPGQMYNDSSDAREDEGWDRTMIGLPGYQEELILEIAKANPKTVVVLIHGLQVSLDHAKDAAAAIVDAHYPGELGGDAIYNVLSGAVSPAGRLTTTYYPSSFQDTRPISDMSLRSGQGITYRYYTGTPQWPFGFGLSYTTFKFTPVNREAVVTTAAMLQHHKKYYESHGTAASPAAYAVEVANTGKVDSDVVVLGFLSSANTSQPGHSNSPLKELFGYSRVHLAAGASTTVHFSVPPQVLSVVSVDGTEEILPGRYTVTFGVDGSAEGASTTASLVVEGPPQTVFAYARLKREYEMRKSRSA
eukprot:Sspe_Gene.16341::Locus_5757_Transcript_1_1_Confidence_1.000_Length_2611::g.16341::m.16341/K15920/XYL4; beta-D-xylosidase 4